MNGWVVKAVFVVVLSGMSWFLSSAKAAEVTTEALLACADEADDARRLRCFDAAVADLPKAPTAPAASAASKPVTPTPPPAASASAEDKFGARGDLRPDAHAALSEITGTVTEVSSKPYGALVITLDNGQTWAELRPSKIRLKTGDSVKIEAGALGSFRLVAPNGRSSKVSRVH